jgi:galactokinase
MRSDDPFIQDFATWSGASAEAVSDAGGRVNLIGDHTDYHEGFVLPAAIGLRTRAAARRRRDGVVRVRSLARAAEVESPLATLNPTGERGWQAYGLSPFWALRELRGLSTGADVLVMSEVPLGSGLSSSASLLVAMIGVLAALADDRLSLPEVANIARYAENAFCGVPSGIMDPMASACGVAEHALFLDCRSLELRPIRMPEAWAIVVADSGVAHSLAGPEYAERRREGLDGLAKLASGGAALSARELTVERLRAERRRLSEVCYRRLRHVVTENARVLEAARALDRADSESIGRLFAASQQSLAEDYEVSCTEIEILVSIAGECDGCIGARLTGAGFGGNTVNLVERAQAPAFVAHLSGEYFKRTGRRTTVRAVEAAAGLSVRRH